MPETWTRRPGLGIPHSVHTCTAGNNIVVVLTLFHRQNRVGSNWRTGSNDSGVEEYLRKQSDKNNTQGNKTAPSCIRTRYYIYQGIYYELYCTSWNRTGGGRLLGREKK